MRITLVMRLWLGLTSLALAACSSADNDNETAAGNIQAINHTTHGINWLKVNGYGADGGGGRSCCIVMPVKWRPGLKAHIEWEVDPDPYADAPPLGSDEFRAFMAEHKKNYRHYNETVDIPEWPGTESCDLKVHFLVCNQVKVTTSCWVTWSPNYPIQEPDQMKEPAVCPK
ncbi:DUF3304 domain-containing protein [Pseudomonas nitroreducens]|uniref:DUF3304 domain-containing protein n=1 Tax=Pseudomonas TaxID=286 RepID=UPI0009F6F208|nr:MULTISPECIES: DUF3304 domain-containing protein [Pseudomonas]MDG9853909.1 DUF3304 domain-containing protein [Pseudomonas nitroreducens]MDH1072756.1 DUF3304 domain-containing protein [Pseudomonas nitroreducens]NMZ72362.1 DUF3304 domain-containing protein [Pseudomonas nitroreducens]